MIRFGGVVVSGDVNSPMPAWSTEVNGPLTVNQIDALTALVETWAAGGRQAQAPVAQHRGGGPGGLPAAGLQGCHGADLAGVPEFPEHQNIGNEPVTDLPTPDHPAGPAEGRLRERPAQAFLEDWIRDSAVNYNDGTPTGMPAHPAAQLPDHALKALITFLLGQKQ